MPQKDKYWYVPWIGVGISALILGAVGRYIALKVSEDTGTATLTCIIVVVGVIFLYVIFIASWETLRQVIFKKKYAEEQKAAEEVIEQIESERKVKDREHEQAHESMVAEVAKLPTNSVLQRKIKTFCKYTDNILAGPVAVEDLPLLHKYIEQYANGNLNNIQQKIKTHTVDTFDLCHYGWNIWNHFDAGSQYETAGWLIKVFEQLKDISPNTIHKKFTHKERMTYIIPLEDNIK